MLYFLNEFFFSNFWGSESVFGLNMAQSKEVKTALENLPLSVIEFLGPNGYLFLNDLVNAILKTGDKTVSTDLLLEVYLRLMHAHFENLGIPQQERVLSEKEAFVLMRLTGIVCAVAQIRINSAL